VKIIRSAIAEGPVAIVVSAFGGVTDGLVAASEAAASGRSTERAIHEIRTRHQSAAEELVLSKEHAEITASIDTVIEELAKILHGASLVGECTPRTWMGC